jgi:hypothetical protein
MVPKLPTYAVIASKDRPEMLANLVAQLAPQCTAVVLDNGYDETPDVDAFVHRVHGMLLHAMWNKGLDHAAAAEDGRPHNVLIINDDVEVAPDVCARLEVALRTNEEIWIAFPHPELPAGLAAAFENPNYDGRTLTGWCFMLRGEAGLRFDEEFSWWYGDSDMERTVRAAGKHVAGVGGVRVQHLDPLRSTENPQLLEMARSDEQRFAAKWDLNPDDLWLAQHPEFGSPDPATDSAINPSS